MDGNERRRQLREELIGAAERRIAERGLTDLKARDLAADVGCAVGTIYNVVPDLDTLIMSVNQRTLRLFEGYIAEHERGQVRSFSGYEQPVARLLGLAATYLEFAATHRHRWLALFQHRLAEDKPVPDWYLAEQSRLFGYIESPLEAIRPDLPDPERAVLARTMFSAVHGMVILGLDEKLAPIPRTVLRGQIETVVAAMGRGLARA